MEGLGKPDPTASQVDKDRLYLHFFDGLVNATSSYWNWNHFASVLELYSKRQITKEADTLNAFLGVMNQIRRSRPTVKLLCGLPFFETSECKHQVTTIDSFAHLVTAALSWHSRTDESRLHQRQSTFPSWTWAGWSGEAEFWLRHVVEARHRPFLRDGHMEACSGQTVVSSALYSRDLHLELDAVALIEFEAPMISAASFAIIQDPAANSNHDDKCAKNYSFRTCNGRIYPDSYRDRYRFQQLIENVQNGKWFCLVLCAGRISEEGEDEEYSIFVLVVRWQADRVTAERMDSFCIYSDMIDDAKLENMEETWTWRRVRLL
jgi:hypothetical protein